MSLGLACSLYSVRFSTNITPSESPLDHSGLSGYGRIQPGRCRDESLLIFIQYVRESSTALLVANLPYIWTLFRRIFKFKALDSLLSQSRTEVPLSGLKRKGNATVFSQGVDPESGRKFSASKYPNMMQYPVKEDPEFQFITTPTSFADSWPSDDSICPSTPSKCLLKDSLCDRRLTPP